MLRCALAITILGSSFPVTRLLLGYPVLAGQALRYALAALILSALVRRGRPRAVRLAARPTAARLTAVRLTAVRLTAAQLARLVALAATGLVGFNVCALAALRTGDPPVLGTVVGAAPLVLALVGPALAGRRPSVRLAGAAAVVVAGVALVEGAGGGHPSLAGLAWAAGALGGEVLFSVLAAPLLPALGAVRVSAWACGLAVPLLLGVAVLTGEWRHWRLPTPTEGAVLGYLGVVLTVGAFLLWYTGLRRLGVERAGLFAGLLPVATLVATAALDGRMPGTLPLAGTALVAVGLVSGAYPARSAARTSSA
jgi:drug/metabolite transporter (DMT)-like permease